jgi:hypothetical protein
MEIARRINALKSCVRISRIMLEPKINVCENIPIEVIDLGDGERTS